MNNTTVFDFLNPFIDKMEHQIAMAIPFPTEYSDEGNYIIMFLALIFTVAVIARLLFNSNAPVLFYPTMILFGFMCGILIKRVAVLTLFSTFATMSYSLISGLFAPLFLFHAAYGIDYHSLGHNIIHILVLSISGTFVHCIIITVLAYPIFHGGYNWNIGSVLGLSVVLAPLLCDTTVTNLNGVQGQVRPLQLLLQGEQLITLTLALYIHSILIVVEKSDQSGVIFILNVAAWQFLGIFIGIFLGILIRYPFRFAYNDVITQVTLGMGTLYFSYYIADFMSMSGALSVVLFGIMLSSTKIKISQETELYTNSFWDYFLFLAKAILYTLAGVKLGYDDHESHASDIGYVILLYILCLVARIVTYTLSSPLLRRSGPLLTWRSIVIAIWGIYRGAPSMLMATVLFSFYDNDYGFRVLALTSMLAVMTLFLNSYLLKFFLGVLGLFDLSRTKRVNMNMAVAQINLCREKAIFSLKLDRVIADANWLVVENVTRIGHPYRTRKRAQNFINQASEDDFGDEYQIRLLSCPDCGGHTLCPPSVKELEDMTLEAKHRILKAQLVSYWRQYDMGILTKRGIRILSNLVDAAVIREDPMLRANDLKIQTDGTRMLRCFKTCFGHLLTVTSKTHRFIPTNIFRAFCLRLCTSRTFQITMATIAMVDLAIIMYLVIIFYFKNSYDKYETEAFYGQIADFVCFSIFSIEFFIQVLGIGFVQYFRSHVNKIEFASGLLVRFCEIFMYVDNALMVDTMPNVLKTYDIIMFLKTMLLLRAVRLYIFWTALIPKLLNCVDRQMDDDLMKSYDTGKAFLVGHERVMKFLAHVVCNETVYSNLRRVLETDRLKVAKDLGMIQKDRPTIAATIKTRHAIRHVVNTMGDCVNDLKEEGILDGIENVALIGSIDNIKKKLREISVVNPCPPDFILREITWLHGDNDTANFFLLHSKLTSFDAGDSIIRFGDDPAGLYVLVSGLVRSFYRPSASIVELSNKFGIIPNYDFFINLKFDLPQEDYIVSGNIIGEIGAVSGRKYDMDVICETAVQVYYVPWKIVRAVVHDSDDAGLMQAKLWKCIGVKLAVNLLQYSSHFQGWFREKLLLYLQRSFVPLLSGVTCLNITDAIDDVILIEGVVMDGVTRAIFYGPFYIPRTVHKIILPDSPSWTIDTTYHTWMLIIPNAHADQNEIIGPQGLFKDHFAIRPPIIVQASETGSIDSKNSSKFPHGPGEKLEPLSSHKLLSKARVGIHKRVGFIDVLPNIKGIEDTMPTTSFVVQPPRRNDIRETPNTRKTQDSTITYVKDIDDQSEGESLKDDQKSSSKSKRFLSQRKRRKRLLGYEFDQVSEGSFEQEMVLRKDKKKDLKEKVRRKTAEKVPPHRIDKWQQRKTSSKKINKTDLTPKKKKPSHKIHMPRIHLPKAHPSKPHTTAHKFLPITAEHSRSMIDDPDYNESSAVKLKTMEIVESLTALLEVQTVPKAVQTDLQSRSFEPRRPTSISPDIDYSIEFYRGSEINPLNHYDSESIESSYTSDEEIEIEDDERSIESLSTEKENRAVKERLKEIMRAHEVDEEQRALQFESPQTPLEHGLDLELNHPAGSKRTHHPSTLHNSSNLSLHRSHSTHTSPSSSIFTSPSPSTHTSPSPSTHTSPSPSPSLSNTPKTSKRSKHTTLRHNKQ